MTQVIWFWAPLMMLSDPSTHTAWAEVTICAWKQTIVHAQGALNINCSTMLLRIKSTHCRNNLSSNNKHLVKDFQRDSEATWESIKFEMHYDMTWSVRYHCKMPLPKLVENCYFLEKFFICTIMRLLNDQDLASAFINTKQWSSVWILIANKNFSLRVLPLAQNLY